MTEIKEYLAMIAAAVSVIVWLVRLEGRVKGQADRLDRHEARMASIEASQHQQAVRAGETGRGENDFVGTYEVTAAAP